MLVQDLRIAVRHLVKSAGFSATAILMLALGIGATTAIFSIVEAVLLRPLPFPNSEQLVSLGDIIEGVNVGESGEVGVTSTDVRNYSRDTHSFENVGGYESLSYELSGIGEPLQVYAARLTAGVFPVLQVAPFIGRIFTKEEDEGNEPVTVISYSLWKNRLHGAANVLGTKILLDRKPYVVIGVMPRDFEFPLQPGHLSSSELWVPMSFTQQESINAGAYNWNYNMVARLKPGITLAQAEEDAEGVAQQTMRSFPAFMSTIRIRASLRSLHEVTVYDARQLIRTLFLAILVVLLIACANLAGLLLVRAIRRRREIALRLALGAAGSTLLRQAILESLVLSVSGGLLGLGLASVGLRLGISRLPETLPRINEIGLDGHVVTFALVLSALTGISCGLAPAFAALRTSVNETLKEGGRTGSGGAGHSWLRSALVVGEIATALVLLTAAGLLLRSFEKMRTVDLGFRPDHVLVAAYSLPEKQYSTQAAIDEFPREVVRRLEQSPGVRFAGTATYIPTLGNGGNTTFVVDNYVPPKDAGLNIARYSSVEGDYFQSMGIPLLAGRLFTPADTVDNQLVAIVNHKLAEHFWPGSNPIGKRFRIGTEDSPTPWMTIVGEVADTKESSPYTPSSDQWYQPAQQFAKSLGFFNGGVQKLFGFITLRSAMPPEQMTNVLRTTVHSLDPQLALSQVQTMEQAVSDSEAPRRFSTGIISSFAIVAVLLAALGIYSVIAFSAALRVQEMAIRIALGSQRSGILGLVLLSAIKLALAGCAIGLIGAAAASHLLDSLLFEVNPFDPTVLTLASLFVLMLAVGASLIPAQRAASVDPMQALRAE